jgi:hypothetical protein
LRRRQAREWACLVKKDLVFFDGDSALVADFDAGLTAQAFFFVHSHGLATLKLVHFDRADIHAFAITNTFVDIDGNRITHDLPPKFFEIPAFASWIRDPYTRSKKL